jgi:ABC-type transport system involved in cytochrome c biogenesis permease subunit
MNSTSRKLSWAFVGVVGLSLGTYLLMAAAGPTPAAGFDLNAFGEIPVVDHGRVKPFDTLARINLMIISGGQSYTDDKGNTQPAVRWLLDVMTAAYNAAPKDAWDIPGASRKVKAYRIDNAALRAKLRLEGGPVFSYEEIVNTAGKDRLDEMRQESEAIQMRHKDLVKNPRELLAALSGQERDIVQLDEQMRIHSRFAAFETTHRVFRIDNPEVLALLGLEPRSGLRYGFDEFLPRLGDLEREFARAKEVKTSDQKLFDHKVLETWRHVEIYMGLASGRADTLQLVAPLAKGGKFLTLEQAMKIERSIDKDDKASIGQAWSPLVFLRIQRDYAAGDKADFNKLVPLYLKEVQQMLPKETARASTEAGFNAFAPFKVCTWFYVVLFLVVCVSWLWPEPALNRFAFWMTILTVCVHTWALCMRMYIQGRPPVTNLYSSAVFIGWVCVLATLVLEWIYRNGIPLAVGTVCGAITLLIAYHLGSNGDTLEMLQAVLDTNFWLATHVTAVTIGYSATFVAGLFGAATILIVLGVSALRAFGQKVEMPYYLMKLMGQCIYGVVCFAMLFSFLGTVLGGIWADYSWGRFWGWDPKENGALLIVIMNALILHARWGGMVKVRGMAMLTLVGSMVMMWSWFGTNQLGVGLHAYGFNKTLAALCTYWWVSQIGLIGLAILPLQAWNPTYTPLVRTPEPAPTPAPIGKKGRRGQIMPGGAT